MTQPLSDAYLAKAEQDAKRFRYIPTLPSHIQKLVTEIRRLQSIKPALTNPPLVDTINRHAVSLVKNKNATTDRSIYSKQDPYAQVFVRNESCWLNSIRNLTCVSPAQLSGTSWNQRAGTLITKKHIIYANHFGIPVIDGGTPILFVTRDNKVIERRLIKQLSDSSTDIAIGLLDSNLPDSIEIASVLPPDFEKYLGARNSFLIVTFDAEEKANIQQCNTFFNGGFSINTLNESYVAPEYRQLSAWSEATIVGDSGNPSFTIIYDELVLLGCFWTSMGGSNVGSKQELVNSMIEQLSPREGYSLKIKML